jgi:hypothetical protein
VNVFIANMELLLQFFLFTLTLSLYRFRDTGAIGLGGLLNDISPLRMVIDVLPLSCYAVGLPHHHSWASLNQNLMALTINR